jgi:subtilisin family serine protease
VGHSLFKGQIDHKKGACFVMGKSVFATKISLALGLILALIFGSAPVGAFAAVIRTTYIVQVQDGFASEVRGSIARLGEYPHDELTEVMDGFVVDLTDLEAEALRLEPYVKQVVADAPMSLMDSQSPVPSWGLDRIDQKTLPLDGAYNFPSNGGQGVRVYVVDTGVMATNPDFAGRMLPGKDMYGQNLENADCHGHGTHVAGTAAGTKFGVAKKAWIVPVRVLSCSGSGSWSYLISAMDWIIANNPAGTPAVMSASIGGGSYPLANAAMEKLYAAGITPVIAAGNSNIDACNTSPAGAPNAITVGASDQNDARASFSNYGECVDVFAPGVSIISDSNTDPTAARSMSGTSMATPHVSGLAALYLSANPTATPAEVTAAIENGGLSGAITNANSVAGNILINNTFTRANVPVAPAPVYPPTAVTASAITSTSATVSWTAPAVSAATTAPESYLFEYKLVTATEWQSMPTVATTLNLSGLTKLSNYVVRVTSIAGDQKSAPTAELQFSTLGTAPDAPTNLIATAIFGNQIDLSWTKPVNTNGAPIGGYYIESLVNGAWTSYNNVGATYGSVRNLTPLTKYSFRVKAFNTIGHSEYSNVLEVSTSSVTPVTPTSITFSGITGTTATVNWKASAQIDAATPITYSVTLLSRQVSNFGAVLGKYTATTNSFTLTGLKRTTYYGVTVTALSGSLVSPTSGQSVFLTGTAKPTSPTQLKLTRLATGMNLSWGQPADNGGAAVTGFQLEKKNVDGTWAIVVSLPATTLSYDVPSPARGQYDSYRLAAVNINGVGDYVSTLVATPAAVPTAPQNLVATRSGTSLTLSWAAPLDDGGAPVQYYAVYIKAGSATTWTALTLGVTGTTFNVALPAKGVTVSYAVAARNSSGTGAMSNSVTETTAATAPSAVRSINFSYITADQLQISWSTPLDNGGQAVNYRLERQQTDGTWLELTTTTATKFVIARDLPGVVVKTRVIAFNTIGEAVPYVANYQTPFVQASAPQNFAAVDNGAIVATTWTAPLELGGSTVYRYSVQISRDNGKTWTSFSTSNGSYLSLNVPRPTKGYTWIYRVVANTGYGLSVASESISISAGITVPNAPGIRSLTFGADGSMNLVWYSASDNGGSVITGYLVEKSIDGKTWATASELPATTTTANFARELPGVRVYFRVKAVNAIGASTPSGSVSLAIPFVRASAPTNFVLTDTGSVVAATWSAPESLGGSTLYGYRILVSKDSGTTWLTLTYPSASTVKVNLQRPTKGQTWSYRIIARTAFGDSLPGADVAITAAATAPSAPSIRGLVINADKSLGLTWAQHYDNGGSPVTSTVVERSLDNKTWVEVQTLDGSATSMNVPTPGPGIRIYFRVKTINVIGASAYSYAASVQTRYELASAPGSVTATAASNRLTITWQKSENLGGSTYVVYRLESNSGSGWVLRGATTGSSYALPLQAKGQAVSYRVIAQTSAGYSTPSAEIRVVG